MNETLTNLGKRIAKLRIQKGFTQEKLAEMVNYSPNHISKLELARTNPSFDLLVEVAHALKVEIKELFDFEDYQKLDYMKAKLNKVINSSETNKIKLLYKLYCSLEK